MSLMNLQDAIKDLERTVGEHAKEAKLDELVRYYQGVHFISKVVKRIKENLKHTIMVHFKKKGIDSYDCVYGSALITSPKSKKLDREAWEKALGENESLRNLQTSYLKAKRIYEEAQEPFLVERDGWLVIR